MTDLRQNSPFFNRPSPSSADLSNKFAVLLPLSYLFMLHSLDLCYSPPTFAFVFMYPLSERNMNPKQACLRKREEEKSDEASGLHCSSTSVVGAALDTSVGQMNMQPSSGVGSGASATATASYDRGEYLHCSRVI